MDDLSFLYITCQIYPRNDGLLYASITILPSRKVIFQAIVVDYTHLLWDMFSPIVGHFNPFQNS